MLNRGVFVLALLLPPATTAAQQPGATLPRIALDGLLGWGSFQVHSTNFAPTDLFVRRAAVTVRLGSPAGFRPVVMLDYFGTWGRPLQVVVCNGICPREFPDISGASVGLGARRTVGRVATVGITGGVGRYITGTDHHTGVHADADIALRLVHHLGAVVNLRYVNAGRLEGSRAWFVPVALGIRIQ
jgi:hypothetical protein